MGICNSSAYAKRKAEWDTKPDSRFKKTSSGDFATFITKLGGGAAAAAAEERALQQIPGRLFSNGATPFASLHTQQGKKGTNQDAMIFWENFYSGEATFCGVFDGHGPYGHMVARRVRDALPVLIRSQWVSKPLENENGNNELEGMRQFDDFMDEESSSEVEDELEKIPDTHIPLKKSMLKAFRLMDKELKMHPMIDSYCSGSTAVALIKQGRDLIIGNVGDSRAVLATRNNNDNALLALQLTVDLKPNLPREAARIHKCKGRVFALQDEPEVARVWLPNSDSPGLAMARAFGDFCLKDFGLISMPDVYHHQITDRDEFVILATDGVWDVLSNKEAVDIVSSAPSRGTASRALVNCATRAWRLKYPTSKTDDCAVVCLFLSEPDAPKSGNEEPDVPEEETMKVPEEKEDNACDGSEDSREIVAVMEEVDEKKIGSINEKGAASVGQSKRSLAECLSTAEDEEWSALEGVTRVNSLLSLPRFSPFDKRSTSWRNWIS